MRKIDRLYNEETSLVNKEGEIKLKELNDKIDEEKKGNFKYIKIIEEYNKIGYELILKG